VNEKLHATRERTKELTEKVRSSLTSLTPHENIYNIPNILTASRLIATPMIGYLVLHEQHKYALALFAYAGITDLVDGWIARRFKLQTVVGSVVDPMADKVLMTVLTVTLATKGLLPGTSMSFQDGASISATRGPCLTLTLDILFLLDAYL